MGYIGAGPTRFNTADELTVTGDAEFDGNLTVKGTHITLDSATVQTVDLGDNDKIRLGDSDDLQIYHDSSDSYITESGTGSLYIGADSTIALTDAAVTQNKAQFITGGAVNLFHNNVLKLATTATGVDVTGAVDISNSSGATLKLTSTDTTGADTELLGQIDFVSSDSSGGSAGTQARIKGVYEDNGDSSGLAFLTGASTGSGSPTLNEVMRIRHEGRVGIGESNPQKMLHITKNDSDGMIVLDANGATTDHQICFSKNYGTGGTTGGNYWGIGVDGSENKLVFAYDPNAQASLAADAKMVIDSSGNVGIGTSSMVRRLEITDGTSGKIRAKGTDGGFIECHNGTNGVYFGTAPAVLGTGGGGDSVIFTDSGFNQLYYTSGLERMRLTSAGKLCIGTQTVVSTSMLNIVPADINRIVNTKSYDATTQFHFVFQNHLGGNVGKIQVSTSATTFVTSSDYRLKTDVTYDWDATTRLKQLKPARFKWIIDGDDAVPVDGFLAHEVQDIIPESISGTKDAMMDEEYEVSAATGDIYTPAVAATYDEDGVELTAAIDEVIHSADVERPEELAEGQQWRETTAAVMGTRSVPDYQGIDQSKLVPLLVKTIQELEARIAALETA